MNNIFFGALVGGALLAIANTGAALAQDKAVSQTAPAGTAPQQAQTAATPPPPAEKEVWKGGVDLTIAYVDTNLSVPNCAATMNCDARAIFTVSKTF